jgi:hypothetical protein
MCRGAVVAVGCMEPEDLAEQKIVSHTCTAEARVHTAGWGWDCEAQVAARMSTVEAAG